MDIRPGEAAEVEKTKREPVKMAVFGLYAGHDTGRESALHAEGLLLGFEVNYCFCG